MIAGDGGFQMTACELATCAQENIKVNIAIINNGYLGMVRQWQQFFYGGRYVATPIKSPDFVKLAEAHGLKGMRVTKREQVRAAVEQARANAETTHHRLPRRAGRQRVPDGAGRRRPRRHDPPPEAGSETDAQSDLRNREGRMHDPPNRRPCAPSSPTWRTSPVS